MVNGLTRFLAQTSYISDVGQISLKSLDPFDGTVRFSLETFQGQGLPRYKSLVAGVLSHWQEITFFRFQI
jgi:hypothetical protein